eukprot:scaffold1118_cov135-Cylindrotheca_fusiformis.AAC.17
MESADTKSSSAIGRFVRSSGIDMMAAFGRRNSHRSTNRKVSSKMPIAYDSEEETGFYQRFLEESTGYGKDNGIDYTVLSVAVQTLLLILFVEIVKHKLDHIAEGRPFFGTVLHSVYSELSTLGIVELFVYIVLKYYKDYDKSQKEVFADVHFALFYTAVFNAFQTVIVAITTIRKSDALWVETEHLELDHYVEIREEFERVKGKLGYEIEDEFEGGSNLRSIPRDLMQTLRNPGLRRHYLDLLVQGNNLPLTLKVSDYLKRSEERVLEKLVHVSGGAWLMLTGNLFLHDGIVHRDLRGTLLQDEKNISINNVSRNMILEETVGRVCLKSMFA